MSIVDSFNKGDMMTVAERCQCFLLERIGDILESHIQQGRPCLWESYGKKPYITLAGEGLFTGEYTSDENGECWALIERENGKLEFVEAQHLRFLIDEECNEKQKVQEGNPS